MMNLDYLQQLMGNDPEKVRQFLRIFASEAPRQIQELKSALLTQSWEDVNITAHSMKSQLRYLSLDHLAQQAQQIENEADHTRHYPSIESRINELDKALKMVLSEVEIILSE